MEQKCPVFKKCGGCQLLELPYDRQLAQKQKKLRELLKPYGKVESFVGMEQPLHYRHKVHAAFDRDRKGNVISGAYREGTHQVVPVESCLLEDEKADAVIGTVRGLLKSFKIKTYDEDTGYGLLRHVLIRKGAATGQIMVVLVIASPIFPSKNNFVKALRKEHPEITTVVVNVNERHTSMVLGDKESVIYGPGYIEDRLCGNTFRISPRSFYQVNPAQAEKLYQKAVEYAGLTGRETVLDAYCGTGTIGIIAAKKAGKVIGVELVKDAVQDAVKNARRNGVRNIRFYQKDAGEFMEQLSESGERVEVVFMDPPRNGSDERFLNSLVRLGPRRVVYISCNPDTMERDVRYLTGRGYEMKKAMGVDMFPFTVEMETVVQLYHQKSTEYFHVDYEPKNGDYLDKMPATATYREIKQWVYDNYNGMKVSSLYVAQIKQKYGIIERECYNKRKLENARVPQCPSDKKAAIEAALKHFKMI